MSVRRRAGRVLTFYSYKGGVGRSMALANVAALLASQGRQVLIVDWDLEAPGIEQYFGPEVSESRKGKPGIVDLMQALEAGRRIDWRDCLLTARPLGGEVHIISAGRKDAGYDRLLSDLSWKRLFSDYDLGRYLEQLRGEWTGAYDFILIDSRTGVTDIGGICTIHLPDLVVALFTANEQSLTGVVAALRAAAAKHQELPVDRAQLSIVPVPSRDESQSEHKKASEWRARFAKDLDGFYRRWLPEHVAVSDALKILRIPYKAYWSFGEPLPVVEDGISEPGSLGYAYALLASLVENGLDWAAMSAGRFSLPQRAKATSPVRRYALIGAALALVGTLTGVGLSGRSPPKVQTPTDAGADVSPKRERFLALARATKDPLQRALILREIPPAEFPAQDAQLLLKGAHLPLAVFRLSSTSARFSDAGDRLLLLNKVGYDVVSVGHNLTRQMSITNEGLKQAPQLGFFALDDQVVVTAGPSGVVTIDANSPRVLSTVQYFLPENHPAQFLTGVSSGQRIFFITTGEGSVGTRNAIFSVSPKLGTTVRLADFKEPPLLAMGLDGRSKESGRSVVVFRKDGSFVPVDAERRKAGKPLLQLSRRSFLSTDAIAAIAPYGGWSIAGSRSSGLLVAWNPPAPPAELATGGPVLALSAGKSQVGFATKDRVVVFRNGTATPYTVSAGDPTAFALGENDATSWLIAGSTAGSLDLWQTNGATGPIMLAPPQEEAQISAVDFDRGARAVYALTRDGTVRVWAVPGRPVLEGAAQGGPAQTLAMLRTATQGLCLTAEERVNVLGEEANVASRAVAACRQSY